MARIVLCTILALSIPSGLANAQTTQWVFYDEPPALQHMPVVLYPCKAIHQRVEGTVRVQALIDKKGHVENVRIVQSVPLLDDEAKRILKESRWEPARDEHGEPVVVWVEIPVRFSLDKHAPSMGIPDNCSEEADRLWRSGVYNKPGPLASDWRYDGADYSVNPAADFVVPPRQKPQRGTEDKK